MGLSGGQMQRIALSRTFMRSVVSEGGPGLLLFDEPSASLDPTAEHDLFERLRQLRGNKTMIFSSHRFGNLTRHADLILYMNDSVVVEEGTHDQLLRQKGEYARIWMLQARAFI
jgi:ABC-type multidrug transport system fused ATPase/permease subunit